MSDEIDLNNDDDLLLDDDLDTGFDDGMDMDFDMFAEEPKPKDRHPVTHSLIKGGTGFKEAFTDDKTETAIKAIKASIPSSLNNEVSQVGEIVGNVTNVLDETTSEIKAQAKPFVKALDKVVPKGGRTESIIKFAKNKLGLDNDEPTSEELAETVAAKAASSVSDILGESQDRELQSQLLLETIKSRRDKSAIELAAISSTNLEYINKFNSDVVSKYQRKSLELQYRHLYTADEQLAVTKTAFDGFKNQFESIVINSALPDLVKTRNSEFVKQKLFSKMTDGLFNADNVINNIKTKFNQEIRGLGTTVSGGLSAATDGIEMASGMSEMDIPGQSKEGMAGGLLADGAIAIGGKRIGDLLSKTKIGKKGIDAFKDTMLDPAEAARMKATGMNEGIFKDALNIFSNFARNDYNEQRFSIDAIDRNGAAMFDGKTQTSITKIIPGLLSKILAQVTSIKTGTETDELRFDYDKGTFESTTNLANNLDADFSKSLVDSGVNRTIDSLINTVSDKTDTAFKDNEIMKIKEGLLAYALTGKSTHPDALKENGLYDMFSNKIGKKVEKSFNKYLETENGKQNLKHGLDTVVKTAPDPQELMDKYDASGSLDILKASGMVDYDAYTKTHKLNNKAYKEALSKSIVNAKEEEESDSTASEETMTTKFFKERAERKQKEKEEKEAHLRDNPEQENFFKRTIKKTEDSIVNAIDKTTDYGISGATKDIKKAYKTTTQKVDGIKSSLSGVKNIDDVKKLIKATDTAKKANELHKLIDDAAKQSDNPNEFLKNLKETEEYKTLSKETKDKLNRTVNIVKSKSKYVKTKVVDSNIDKLKNEASKTVSSVKESTIYKKVEDSDTVMNVMAGVEDLKESIVKLSAVDTLNNIKTDLWVKVTSIIEETEELEQTDATKAKINKLNNLADKIERIDFNSLNLNNARIKLADLVGEVSKAITDSKLTKDTKSKFENVDFSVDKDKVKSVMGKLPGFSKGGYTGKGPKDEVAGITHRDEEVVDSDRLDKIAEVLGIKDLSRDKLVDNLISSTETIKDTVVDFAKHNDTIQDLSKSAKEMTGSANSKMNDIRTNETTINIVDGVTQKLKVGQKFFGDHIQDASESISNKLNLEDGIKIPDFNSSKLDDVLNSIKDAKDKASSELKVKVFVAGVNKVIMQVEDFIMKNPHKSADIKTKLEDIRSKVESLLSDTDTSKLSDLIKDISESVSSIVSDMTPNSSILSKKAEDFKKKETVEGTDEDTFLDILNSEDPVGSMKAKIKHGIKAKIKGMIVGGAKGIFNLGKKIIKSDLERGSKLRGFLKRKLFEPQEGEEHGFIRNGANKAFNVMGAVANKFGKGAKTTAKIGADVVNKDVELGKKLQDKIADTVKNAVADKTKDTNREGIAGSANGKSGTHDKDGDGLRDGSWLAKIRKRKADKDKNDDKPTSVLAKIAKSAKSPIGMSMVVAGLAMGMKAMGVSLDDISGFAKGAWETLKGIGSVLGGIWDSVKSVVGGIKTAFGNLKKGLSKVPVIGKYFEEEDVTANMSPAELAKHEAEADSKLAGNVAMGLAGAYAGKKAYNIAKPVFKGGAVIAKGSVKTAKASTKLAAKAKKKIPTSKIMSTLKSFKTLIFKKFGKKAGKVLAAKLTAKIAARVVPILGLALLVYDASKIAYDMYTNDTKLKNAISKQILGFDLFSNDVALDSKGKEIKPDEELDDYVKNELADADKTWEDAEENSQSEELAKKLSPSERRKKNQADARKRVAEAKRRRAMEISNYGQKYHSANNASYGNSGGRNYKPVGPNGGWKKVKGFESKHIGDVSAYFESGGRGPGTVSSGRGDRGGVSYGTHQLASKVGTLQKYLAGSKYGPEFNGLRPGSAEFTAKWKEIAKNDPKGFEEDQEAYISKTHYQPQANKVKSGGLNLDKRSDAVKSAVYSVGVQFGPNTGLIKRALDKKGVDPKTSNDKEVINGIYDYKKENNNKLFKSSSYNVQQGTLKRAYKEEDLVLNLLSKDGTAKPANNIGHRASDKPKETAVDRIAKLSKKDIVVKPEPIINIPEKLPKENMVAGPAMVDEKKTVTQPTKPMMGSVVTELKEVTNTAKLETAKQEVSATGINVMVDATKGIYKMNKTLEDSLSVQRATLEAVKELNEIGTMLLDRDLKLTDEEKKDVKPQSTDNSSTWDVQTENATKGTMNFKRKKHA